MLTLILAFILILIAVIFKLKGEKTSERNAEIPGPKKNESDNLDVEDYSNQTELLDILHKKYGPIVSFWEGDRKSVSIASPELMKETRNLSNVTLEINEPFRKVLGDHSLLFTNGEEAKERRKLYDQFFMLKAVNTYFDIMKEIAEEFVNKWKTYTPTDHIPIMDVVGELSIKSILRTCFGDYFKDDEKLNSFRKDYECVLSASGFHITAEERMQLENANKRVKTTVKEILDARQEQLQQGADRRLFIDVLLDHGVSEGQRDSDGLGFLAASDTAAFFYIWLIYELVKDPALQERIYEEIQDTVEDRTTITIKDLPKLKYLRQVIDETIRYYSTFHTGRIAEKDMVVGGYVIPEGTNIYQHLGACLKDPKSWKDPQTFDPDHFKPENSKGRSPFAFKPFGCSGKRICPGTSYSYVLFSSFIAIWIQNFKMQLVPGQKVVLSKGVFKKPADELWFTVIPRN